MEKQDIKSLTLEELTEAIRQMGDKPFRAKQIYQWLHQKLVADFDEMSNLSKPLREKLKEQFVLTALYPVDVKISQIDGTRKYLFRLADGNVIESVWMQYHHGNSVCISSQVGCRMGCQFCASTIAGYVRDLMPSELLLQIYETQRDAGCRIDSIVLMGIGWIQGIQQVCMIFQTAILLAAGAGICMLAIGKGRKKEIPFVPFLLAGYLIQYL